MISDLFDSLSSASPGASAGAPVVPAALGAPRPAPLVLEVQTPVSVSLDAILGKRRAAIAAGLARPLSGSAGEHGTPDMLDPTAGPVPLLCQPVKPVEVDPVPSLELVGSWNRCVPAFQMKIAGIAAVLSLSRWTVFEAWRDYSAKCYDQSALLSEFICRYGEDSRRELEEVITDHPVDPVFEIVEGEGSDPASEEIRTIWDAQEGESGPFLICAPPESAEVRPVNVRPFAAVLAEVKAAGEDFEWYPTTSEIIRDVCKAIPQYVGGSYERRYSASREVGCILDVGAGDGKVLEAIKRDIEGKGRSVSLYAIEKSAVLIQRLDPSVYIIGTEFEAQSLYSKKMDVIFSNPPYSQFQEWSAKIIRESAAPLVLLVIPERWKDSEIIKAALDARGCKTTKILGSYDFASAEDRQARCKVNLVSVSLPSDPDSAFEAFFNETFGEFVSKHEEHERRKAEEAKAAREAAESQGKPGYLAGGRRRPFQSLVVGENYPAALCNLYSEELANIQRNYEAISKLDPELLREFEVYPKKIMELLKKRTEELRKEYWLELFSKLKPITNRLTAASRKSLLETLNARADVDFTEGNIHAVLVWAIKNANTFIDRQLLAVYENMIDKANVTNYKSNARVFVERSWRYEEESKVNSHYALDLRIVCGRVGGIDTASYSHHCWRDTGLTEDGGNFLADLITIANNLGFACSDSPREHKWTSGLSVTFRYTTTKGVRKDLFKVRAFYNRNIHIKFAKEFILALNVEHGRLKGWLRDAREAAVELKDPAAAACFKSTFQILPGSGTALLLA